ncbi:AraC family transcriptional regulator [Geodermatophilus ruber]|uniref:Helix-turn-helix domain-containing protein n=1 Tax=Geodermatophilus ruber TaxID=504800 RepID=A0A1I4C2B0_9ACTN|nr:AraC family transcriptional regulator [Geodermatophilus ruber]SFK74923.1 Helix-turn-helix domain-containing protein [Geodermatophilus ruber]
MAAEPFGRFPVARTADVDEAQEAMRSTFLPLTLRPLDPVGSGGDLDLGLNATRVGDVTVTYVRFGRGVQIDTAEADNYHVNLPITGGTVSRSGRLEPVASTPQLAAVFMPELDAELEWQAGTAQFCLMLPRHVLQQELEAMLDRPLAAPLAFAPAMDVTGDAGRAWVDALRLIERQSRYSHGLLDHPLAAGNLQRILVDGLLLAQPHTYTDALAAPHPPAAPPAIHRAIELLHTHPEQPWTTAGLARTVAVSARSLQDGFARTVGIPPTRYLREIRLQRIHEDLQAADPHTTTVSSVASRWGVLYLSRMAATYREKFGESPSQTLRHAPTRRRTQILFRAQTLYRA